MRKEQKADKLLIAAKHWQNGNSCYLELKTKTGDLPGYVSECFMLPEIDDRELLNDTFSRDATIFASAALSEVAGMGFDIVNADGSECEKVAKVFRAALTKAPTGHRYGYVVEVCK